MANRLRNRCRFGATQYRRLRDLAIAAARANNASLWFAGSQSDLAGFVFQDSFGNTSATGTDPVGLLLDRAYGTNNAGPELRSTAALVVSGVSVGGTYNAATGQAFLPRTDVSNRTDLRVAGLTIGGVYRVTITNSGPSAVTVRVATGGVTLWTINSGQTLTGYAITQTAGNITIVVGTNASSATLTLSSVQEIFGVPALQATAANKPTLLQNSAGYFDAVFDATNDTLSAALPSGGSPSVVSFTDTGEVTGFVSATTTGFVIGNPTVGGRKVGVIVASATALPASDLAAIRAFAGVVRGAPYP